MRIKDAAWVVLACVLLGVVAVNSAADIEDWRFSARLSGERVELTLRSPGFFGGDRMHTHVQLDRFDGLDPRAFERGAGPVEFRLVRDAGTITFYGEASRRLRGTLSFAADPEFEALLASLGDPHPDEDDLFRLARHDVGRVYLQRIVDLGYETVRASTLVRLHAHEVPLDYLEAVQRLGYRPELDEVLRLFFRGFDEKDVEAYAGEGLTGIPVPALLRLQVHQVDPPWIRRMIDAGLEQDQVEVLIRLHVHGVDPELVAQAKLLETESSIDDLIRFRNHDVSAAHLATLIELQLADLTPHEIVALRSRGVESGYVEELRRSGWGPLSTEQVIMLDNHGVASSYLKQIVDSGMPDVDLQDVVRLRNHGVDADYFTPLAARGHDAGEIVRLLSHGVDPAVVAEMDRMGYTELGVEELVRLRTHGVEADLLRRLSEAGYSDLTVGELIEIRQRGIDDFLTRRQTG